MYIGQTKQPPGRIVFASYENPPDYGVELDKPANIWELIDAPPDWREIPEDPRGPS